MPSTLVIFNINTKIEKVLNFLPDPNANYIFLTPHGLYDNEIGQISRQLNNVEFYSFGSFNDNDSLLEIDKQSFLENEHLLNRHYIYLNNYKIKMNELKNEFIHNALRSKFNFDCLVVFCSDDDLLNLGISYTYWKKQNADLIITREASLKAKHLRSGWLAKLSYYIQAQINTRKQVELYSFKHDGTNWITPSLYRLKLKKDIKVLKLKTSYNKLRKEDKQLNFVIGLHECGKLLNLAPCFVPDRTLIVGDAFRPTNYPPYLFAYPIIGRGEYVPKDGIDAQFFSNSGCEVLNERPIFLESDDLKIAEHGKELELKTIILSLNHAGDWTALISRSDTDLLISSFASTARKFPDLEFIIRTHPTMTGPRAEGEGSLDRIKKFIAESKLPNLKVSELSLEEDWERGDLFISEYSLSVIDAIKKGKLGVFYNITGRQSFMIDWEQMGIKTITSNLELEELLIDQAKKEALLLSCQNAMKEYIKTKHLN